MSECVLAASGLTKRFAEGRLDVTVLRGGEVLRFKVKRTALKSRLSLGSEEQVTER